MRHSRSRVDLVLLLLIALAPAQALVAVNPVRGLSLAPIPWIALAAILLGFWLAGSDRRVGHHLAVIGSGVLGVVGLTAVIAPDVPADTTGLARLLHLFGELGAWVSQAVVHRFTVDDLLFFLLCASLAWTLGYAGGGLLARGREVWLPVVAGIALLALILVAYPGLAAFAPVQLVAAVVLLGRVNRQARWTRRSAPPQGGTTRRWEGIAGVALAVALVAGGWLAPTTVAAQGVAGATTTLRDEWTRWSRLSLPWIHSAGPPSTGGFGSLAFHGAFQLADTPVLRISSPRPAYWRAVAYDTYTGQGWTSNASTPMSLRAGTTLKVPLDRERSTLVQDVTILAARGDYLVGAAGPVAFDRASTLQAFRSGKAVDLLSAQARASLVAGSTYEVTSEVSTTTPEQLRAAGTRYPPEIRGDYLALPAVPRRVSRLARQLTARQSNPYDQALAIENYLHTLTYSENVPAPPPGRDGVDYFLFQTRAGYCDYFASAMAVMLRSVGVPTRVVSGYATGEPQPDGTYLVRDSSAHSWTEVYFPDYGWIPFEPTAGWQDLPRGPENAPPPVESITPPADLGAATSPSAELTSALADAPRSVEDAASWAEDHPFPIVGVLGTALVVLSGGLGWYVWRRPLVGLPAPVAVYARMVRVSTAFGRGPRPSDTPTEYARTLARDVPEASEGIERIASEYNRFVFGRRAASGSTDALQRWREVRDALIRRAFRRSCFEKGV